MFLLENHKYLLSQLSLPSILFSAYFSWIVICFLLLETFHCYWFPECTCPIPTAFCLKTLFFNSYFAFAKLFFSFVALFIITFCLIYSPAIFRYTVFLKKDMLEMFISFFFFFFLGTFFWLTLPKIKDLFYPHWLYKTRRLCLGMQQ